MAQIKRRDKSSNKNRHIESEQWQMTGIYCKLKQLNITTKCVCAVLCITAKSNWKDGISAGLTSHNGEVE